MQLRERGVRPIPGHWPRDAGGQPRHAAEARLAGPGHQARTDLRASEGSLLYGARQTRRLQRVPGEGAPVLEARRNGPLLRQLLHACDRGVSEAYLLGGCARSRSLLALDLLERVQPACALSAERIRLQLIGVYAQSDALREVAHRAGAEPELLSAVEQHTPRAFEMGQHRDDSVRHHQIVYAPGDGDLGEIRFRADR